MRKFALLAAAWLLALTGAVSSVSAVDDSRATTYTTVTATNLTTSATSLFMLSAGGNGDQAIVTCTTPNGGLLFLDSTTTTALAVGTAQTNTVLINSYATLKRSAIPIFGTGETSNPDASVVVFKPGGKYGMWTGRIFFCTTNSGGTNVSVTISKYRNQLN